MKKEVGKQTDDFLPDELAVVVQKDTGLFHGDFMGLIIETIQPQAGVIDFFFTPQQRKVLRPKKKHV